MSSRGLVNRELANAKRMIGRAADDTQIRLCACQLLFAFRCFLLEVAETHQLASDREYCDAESLLSELSRKNGAGTTIAELASFAESAWSQPLEASQQAHLALQNSARASQTKLNQNVINAVQLSDIQVVLSQSDLVAAFEGLRSLVVQMRELTQEY